MPDLIPSPLASARLSEKDAWHRYAEAKGDDWPEAYAKWVDARDAALTAWTDDFTDRHK